MDGPGNVYIADSSNHRIRKVTAATGVIATIAGTGTSGFGGDGGVATAAKLDDPSGVTLDGAGNVYIADSDNNRIRKVTALPPGGSDFDGDGRADVLWRHATRGEVWLWPMDGAARTAETYVRTVADTDWEIRGLGDQTGDGKADILWRQQDDRPDLLLADERQHAARRRRTWPRWTRPTTSSGTGDYNGDGKSDILWRHLTNGEVWIWLMDGATPLSQVYVDTVDPAYVVEGVGRPERRRQGRHRVAPRHVGRSVGVADERDDPDQPDPCGDRAATWATRSWAWRTTRATGRRTSCGATRRAAKCGSGR